MHTIKFRKAAAVAAIAVALGAVVAPAASAATPSGTSPSASDIDGSVAICFPLGSVVWCI